jgi:GDP-L-fucose synthase
MMEESRKNEVKKFIAIGTVCSYPKFAAVPFSEEKIWDGYPEETNASYGLSKKMMLVQSDAYRQEYNFKSIVLVQTNLYGPEDNFDPNTSHVIPALIKKIHDAKVSKKSEIELWGDGSPSRDFLYVDDAARAAILAAEKYEKSDPINIGSGKEITIKELAELIKKLMNAENISIKWNIEKPGGQPRRCLNIEKAEREIGFIPTINMKEGLRRTIEWYENKQEI